uniref:G protein gamma domain-containing protein n=1 Tax=Populus davidiana TaxID=266767 RepID=A0A6M2F5B5_9ROSI
MESDSVEMDGQHSVSSLEEPKREESVAAETSSFIPRTRPNNFLSKHRMVAAITQLQNQINFIQEELDQLDTLGESSIVCEELLSSVESIPDPLLPSTQGPVNASWDRWFKGNQNSRRRWI